MARTIAQRRRNIQRPSLPLSIARKEICRLIFSYSSLVSLTSGNCYENPQAGEIVAAILVVVNFNDIPAGDFNVIFAKFYSPIYHYISKVSRGLTFESIFNPSSIKPE